MFSSTLERTDWKSSVLVRGDVPDAVRKLKEEGDGNLVLFGRTRLSQTLFEHGLLDRLRFAVRPVVGDPLGPFRSNPRTPLTLLRTHARPSGVVVLDYGVGWS